jgi:hypothetical protein
LHSVILSKKFTIYAKKKWFKDCLPLMCDD